MFRGCFSLNICGPSDHGGGHLQSSGHLHHHLDEFSSPVEAVCRPAHGAEPIDPTDTVLELNRTPAPLCFGNTEMEPVALK